jgi:hypothetical protein
MVRRAGPGALGIEALVARDRADALCITSIRRSLIRSPAASRLRGGLAPSPRPCAAPSVVREGDRTARSLSRCRQLVSAGMRASDHVRVRAVA